MTPEELDEATVKEAKRRLVNSGKVYGPAEVAALAARLARSGFVERLAARVASASAARQDAPSEEASSENEL